jgi:hypothetical protein
MTKLDIVLEHVRRLPQDRQDAIAAELEFLLQFPPTGKSFLTDDQWAEVEAALADVNEETASHDDVMARGRAKLAE